MKIGNVNLTLRRADGTDNAVDIVANLDGLMEPIARVEYRAAYAHHDIPCLLMSVFARSAGRRGEVTDNIIVSVPTLPAEEDATCECGGKGWDLYNGNEIQRCDLCCRFACDEDASAFVMKQLEMVPVTP